MKHLRKVVYAYLAALLCSSALASVGVSLTPSTVQVKPGGQFQFAAVVSGTTNSVVIWSLAGTNCSGIACGQITSGGLYLAPATAPHPNVITVTATSLADLSARASAAVIVGTSSDITVSVSPAAANVLAAQQQKFVAVVSGSTITGVTWKLVGGACAASACGSISSDGVYKAPATPPSPAEVTVQAISIADPSRSGSAAVTVTSPVKITISPTSANVLTGGQQQFSATVLNTNNTSVNWSLAGSGCTGSGCGTITNTGLYTAPSVAPKSAQ